MKVRLYPTGETKTISILDLKKMGQVRIQGKIILINNKTYAQIENMED